MKLIDTHCHLTFDELASQVGLVLRRAREAGVERVVNIATSPDDARRAVELLAEERGTFFVFGVHPHEASNAGGKCEELARMLTGGEWDDEIRRRVVAVGETGLDYHYDFAPRDDQERVFRFQLELAQELNLPAVIHAREAEVAAADMLRDYPALAEQVVFHSFSANKSIAKRVLDGGHMLSFTGIATFKNAADVREAARYVPVERMMVETDAPYLSPTPVRSVRPCEPAFVAHTAAFLARLHELEPETFADRTTANAERFFNLPESAA